MTREEAILKIGELVAYARTQGWDDDYTDAFKTLEQEPCEDTISREKVLGCFEFPNTKRKDFIEAIKKLPPVTPMPLTCEDVVSRQAVEKITWEEPSYSDALNVLTEVRDKVRALPSVTPTTCIAKVTFDKDELQKIVDEKVKELPVTQKWIPVSERLPKYGKDVLTCDLGGFIEIQSIEYNVWDEYSYWENQKGDWTDFDEVTAWMPLPQPYKAESEDKE